MDSKGRRCKHATKKVEIEGGRLSGRHRRRWAELTKPVSEPATRHEPLGRVVMYLDTSNSRNGLCILPWEPDSSDPSRAPPSMHRPARHHSPPEQVRQALGHRAPQVHRRPDAEPRRSALTRKVALGFFATLASLQIGALTVRRRRRLQQRIPNVHALLSKFPQQLQQETKLQLTHITADNDDSSYKVGRHYVLCKQEPAKMIMHVLHWAQAEPCY